MLLQDLKAWEILVVLEGLPTDQCVLCHFDKWYAVVVKPEQ